MVCLWRQLVDVWPYIPIPLCAVVFLVTMIQEGKRWKFNDQPEDIKPQPSDSNSPV